MPRCTNLRHPVTFQLDGEAIEAELGEPVAVALIAAGKLALARSAKFHRPRGPSCLRAACDGCLARVDGRPNVMTCMVPAAEGTVVKTQNALGSREVDLLRVTDWFFPKGMNHHELFAGVPGLQGLMQTFARRVAGLGKLPSKASEPRSARRRQADVVVVGGGGAGMAIAARAADAGRRVEVIDDAIDAWGTLWALGGEEARPWEQLVARFDRHVAAGAITLRMGTTAAALYGDDLLVAGEDGAEIVTAKALVLAPGAHDGVLAFEGNDVPGILSARAAGWLLARGVVPGERVLVCVTPGADGTGEAFARAASSVAADGCRVELVQGVPLRAEGSARVKGVRVKVGEAGAAGAGAAEERHFKADTLVIDAPRAPAYELCEQAGARLRHEPRGFVPQTVRGKIRDRVFALGEVTGAKLEVGGFEGGAEEIVGQL
ncbi:MAG: 2Fe-2S iron-sulfur cluster-binding protein [Polyangiaceae bacterium]